MVRSFYGDETRLPQKKASIVLEQCFPVPQVAANTDHIKEAISWTRFVTLGCLGECQLLHWLWSCSWRMNWDRAVMSVPCRHLLLVAPPSSYGMLNLFTTNQRQLQYALYTLRHNRFHLNGILCKNIRPVFTIFLKYSSLGEHSMKIPTPPFQWARWGWMFYPHTD